MNRIVHVCQHVLLEQPLVYRLSQLLLAPGDQGILTQRIAGLARTLPDAQRLLDVGCGPRSWLWRIGLHPIGLDISQSYTVNFHGQSKPTVRASAAALPFASNSLNGVWSIGLLHHLPDLLAVATIEEMVRVCAFGGYVVIFDAVLPDPPLARPVAYFLRRIDRGRFVRREEELRSLISSFVPFTVERITYSHTGLEALCMVYVSPH